MTKLLWVQVLVLFLIPTTTESFLPPPVISPTQFVSPQLKRICSCESMQGPNGIPKQFDKDGSVMRGRVNHQDIGACQINLTYHEAEAIRLGFDLFTWNGNVGFANWLYKQEGSTPWNWSKSCWVRE